MGQPGQQHRNLLSTASAPCSNPRPRLGKTGGGRFHEATEPVAYRRDAERSQQNSKALVDGRNRLGVLSERRAKHATAQPMQSGHGQISGGPSSW